MFFVPFIGAGLFIGIMGDILKQEDINQIALEIIADSVIPLIIYALVITSSVRTNAYFYIRLNDGIARSWAGISNIYARITLALGVLLPMPLALMAKEAVSFISGNDVSSSNAKWIFIISCLISLALVVYFSKKAFEDYAPENIPPIMGRGQTILGIAAAIGWLAFAISSMV